MLDLPEAGLGYSVHSHNIKGDVLCDWIEGTLLFGAEDEVSQSEIIDVLLKEEVYRDRDFAWEGVDNAWSELKRRELSVGTVSQISVERRKVRRQYLWQDNPAHGFCLLLAFAHWYRGWAKQFRNDYTEQGELFEELVKESLEHQFSGWKIDQTGWSRTNINRLAIVVQKVADTLGESVGNIHPWTTSRAKDAGLDLLCYRPFLDGRIGVPVYLMQCASGSDWDEKLHTPDMKIWTKMVVFTATPRKAFATPFAFLDDDFRRNCNIVDGILLDRYRLLAAAGVQNDWVSKSLKERLTEWIDRRISVLPWLDE